MTLRGPETEEADGRPLHERIAADLRDDIISGALAPGDTLPSTAQLKERFGAANATIQGRCRPGQLGKPWLEAISSGMLPGENALGIGKV